MSDLVGNPDCWFSHAKAQMQKLRTQISCAADLPLFHLFDSKIPLLDFNDCTGGPEAIKTFFMLNSVEHKI